MPIRQPLGGQPRQRVAVAAVSGDDENGVIHRATARIAASTRLSGINALTINTIGRPHRQARVVVVDVGGQRPINLRIDAVGDQFAKIAVAMPRVLFGVDANEAVTAGQPCSASARAHIVAVLGDEHALRPASASAGHAEKPVDPGEATPTTASKFSG